MTDQPHKIYTEEFDEADATAAGVFIAARMTGKQLPNWTEDMVETLRTATAEVFDAGFRTGRDASR